MIIRLELKPFYVSKSHKYILIYFNDFAMLLTIPKLYRIFYFFFINNKNRN